MHGGEGVAVGSLLALAAQDTGDHGIGIVLGQAAHKFEGVLVGSDRRLARLGAIDVEFGQHTPAPAQRQVGGLPAARRGDDDFVEQCAQQLLLVPRRGGGRLPDPRQVHAKCEHGLALVGRQFARSAPLAAFEFGPRLFEFAQALFPFRLEAAGDEAILGLDGTVPAFGALGFIARPFEGQTPLFERAVVIGFDPFGGAQRGLETGRLRRVEHGLGHRPVDLYAADVQAVHAACLDDVLTRTVIARRGVSSLVVDIQPPPAVAARGDALQQRASFSDRAAPRRMRSRPRVAADAGEVILVGRPVDIARVVVGDQHRPLRARYSTHTLSHHTVFVDDAFLPRFAVRVGAGIGRIGEYLMNRMIRRRNPADGVAVVQAQREGELLGDEPQPDAAHRPEFGEPLENRANSPGDRFVGMQPDLAVALAPDEPDRQTATQLSAGRLVADPTVEARMQDMQFGL